MVVVVKGIRRIWGRNYKKGERRERRRKSKTIEGK